MSDAAAGVQAKAAASPTIIKAGERLVEIDMLRGLVIVIMALDHVRDYFHAGAANYNPLDPAQTTTWLYLTRWITHLCAPTFVFLAGVSAFLQAAKGKTGPALSGFLVTRGLWLVALELTVLSFGWSFGFPYPIFMQVIWAIGWSMIALAALVMLPRVAVLAIGLIIVCGHNLLDPITPDQLGGLATLWTFLHEGGPIFVGEQPIGIAAYPVLPWIGVMAVGYGAGPLFLEPSQTRDRKLVLAGVAMIALFLLLRGFNLYGNPIADNNVGGPFGGVSSWRDQADFGAMAMAFFDVQKYPPSLMYMLVTLGICMLLLVALRQLKGPAAKVLLVFGAVPFFFYVAHIYLVHMLAILANGAVGRDVSPFFGYMMNVFVTPERLEGLGFSLPWVYLAWVIAVALLYLPCAYWAGLKKRRRDWWLSYL
ncbi:MAG: heparan-alpha-glucosaminide N-acetyltransferase domain-containing protein [Hyphomonadaceae bacterium]|nr:heparan-alpha-glucosaminide N-acetyltransferase domain-containing protein [Hyphomonadaceae bacterium]